MIKENDINFENLEREDLIKCLNAQGETLLRMMEFANSKRDNKYITYSKNVFIPLTEICKNDCGYCAFKKSPEDPNAIILMDKEKVIETLKEAEKYGCKEAMFAMGGRCRYRRSC